MSILSAAFSEFAANPPRMDLIAAGAVGVTFAFTAWAMLQGSAVAANPLRRRLRALRGEQAFAHARPGRLSQWLDRLRPYVEPKQDALRAGLERKLLQAGLTSPRALALMYLAKGLFLLLLPAAVVLFAWTHPHPKITVGFVLFVALVFAFIGWLVPNMLLDRRHQARQRTILEGLPDALDLLVACTEAGLGLNAAIERVAEQMPASNPLLARELQQVNAEIRAGVDRLVAMRNFAERTGLEDVRGLVALMNQSTRFGTGIAETLRIYSEEFRDRRMQRAEEMAGKVGTKLIFPLCFCIFPAFFVVATGPAVVGVVRVLAGVEWPAGQ